jgi:hypothetical protein
MNKKIATVRNVILCWEEGGILALKIFLEESEVFEGTWVSKIKDLLENGHTQSVIEEIKLVAFNLNLSQDGRKQ